MSQPLRLAESPATAPAPGRRPSSLDAVPALAERLAQQLEAGAAERDRAGGHAAAERELIRASGLLALSVPRSHGGWGGDWPLLLRVVRRLAQADSALAHVFAFHHLQLAGVLLYGSEAQQRHFLRETVEQDLFWGNALNPLDLATSASRSGQGWLIDGRKSFASGSVGSDRLTVSAWHAATQTALIAVLPTRREGVTVEPDWDAFGQRQTDSGTVRFERVWVSDAEVLQPPGVPPTPQATLRSQVAQLIMANLYLGIGEGARQAALHYLRQHGRPWFAAGVASALDDPYVQHRHGEFAVQLRGAELLADAAAGLLDQALYLGPAVSAEQRGEVAVAVAQAKVAAHRAGVEVSSQLFELTGARSTARGLGLDRYWRNVRVHTLHDPIDYKLRDLGRHALSGRYPEPTAYS
ncbi:acyl-CoA dehydrogenase family protein [Eleftheria terrae]|uniref:acyl-CoA dehydrogenase family protein n=1 Tax=Eleftheria terrae TaxID=1597781 RepID=UPI00263B0B69|nr:acyl-CoA dehydrogenase family protein [Eleftheria terrae]WKB54690.1 acyl-CoA dehydrogenase family protein [Eleftheria terrae]